MEWILCKTDVISLIDLISKKIDLHTIFLNSDKMINIITDNEGNHITEVQYANFNKSFLPTPGVKLKPNIDLTYYFYDLYKNNINPEPIQSTRFIDFKIDIVNDEIKYTTNPLTSKIEYNLNTIYNDQEEYTRIILTEAA